MIRKLLDLLKPKNRLFGVNLEKYHYLGYKFLSYVDEDNKETKKTTLHFFVNKINEKRLVRLQDKGIFLEHPYYTGYVPLWLAKEKLLYVPIRFPSDYCDEYCRKINLKYDYVKAEWDTWTI